MNTFKPITKKYGFDANYVIDHIDGNKQNNHIENLEWVSQKENYRRIRTIHYFQRKVVDLDTKEVFDSELLAAKSVGGKKSTCIHRVCVGERKHYKGHRFAFMEDVR
jgi:hypothetical protein